MIARLAGPLVCRSSGAQSGRHGRLRPGVGGVGGGGLQGGGRGAGVKLREREGVMRSVGRDTCHTNTLLCHLTHVFISHAG
jgi:hypothetical protein